MGEERVGDRLEGVIREVSDQPPSAILFDAYGTLFDVNSLASLAEELYPGRGAALAAHGATNKWSTRGCPHFGLK
jgi:hypothetical protein